MAEKPVFWVGTSLDDLRTFPKEARRITGHQLHLVQLGLNPKDCKPMPIIGTGVSELRIHTGLEHRVFYLAKFSEGIHVLHAFQKKTRKTPKREIELARQRRLQLAKLR
ncbi:MAG: type II toxin-antitoxin system RelE/ParE family toxin [Acidobacteria bacterium]|nr:type II toxin-antitoxin system RelE/ParE family toxin [Acidobacteriota bacterium]MCI0620711.1 type II toxin-antitoxin system RelE/ParE family toxin [Acidobacteriota bacterium]MCI0719245.1 type II toxin-antitoxin system RelE/ParE family toxin [Acidobacteriota bacterium]